ncbi:phospholipase A1 EG1, chloroplastic/mitochondrial-like [Oryza brachyantha]|uniref:phospholipase A1 EG1, chloroplastic/mitochondrial-like n=1 Tax=Oryza brachyantha TaxID=4533 RepID=UPI001ADCD7C8|nr:phospholipase A1 EG1, chloroplastic/mitochondrial-like [Oryza brachyantha]
MAFTSTSLELPCTMLPATATTRRHARLGTVRCTAAAATASAVATSLSPAAERSAWAPVTRTSTSRAAPASTSGSVVARVWRKIQGSGDWDGMLEPLHPLLRGEVARYGELVGACYAALEEDPSSARYMNCKYGKRRMLEDAGVAGAPGYEVTRYIYSSSDAAVPGVEASTSGRASWVGYVAVSTDETTRRLGRRDVLVSLRGTITPAEWMANLKSSLVPAHLGPRGDDEDDVKVESGFLSVYTSADETCRFGCADSCRDQLLREVSRLVTSHSGEDVSVTLAGHSMGGALALLLAYDLAGQGLNRAAPVTVFSYGGPRVGNAAFKARCDELGIKVLRVANARDPVTKVPGVFLNEATTRSGPLAAMSGACYTHVGQELALDFINLSDLGSVHDLGSYVACLKEEAADCGEVATTTNADAGVLAMAMELVGGRQWQWKDAAMAVGGLVQSTGLI